MKVLVKLPHLKENKAKSRVVDCKSSNNSIGNYNGTSELRSIIYVVSFFLPREMIKAMLTAIYCAISLCLNRL